MSVAVVQAATESSRSDAVVELEELYRRAGATDDQVALLLGSH